VPFNVLRSPGFDVALFEVVHLWCEKQLCFSLYQFICDSRDQTCPCGV